MELLRKMRRFARDNVNFVRDAKLMGQVQARTSQSGLGDSAFLLYGLVKSAKPNVVVEIGSARGRSTCFIGRALKENGHGRLHAIDPHTKTAWNDGNSEDTFDILTDNIQKLGLDAIVEIIRETSETAASTWTREIDMLFIDGDHSYAGARRDWELFSPFVKPFGSVIFHDTLWDLRPDPRWARPDMGVPRVVEELRQAGYPVITIDRDFGVSIVQPVKGGMPLKASNGKSQTNSNA